MPDHWGFRMGGSRSFAPSDPTFTAMGRARSERHRGSLMKGKPRGGGRKEPPAPLQLPAPPSPPLPGAPPDLMAGRRVAGFMLPVQGLLRCCPDPLSGIRALAVAAPLCSPAVKRTCSDTAMPSSKVVAVSPVKNTVLKFAKLSENAYRPTRGSERAAGYDLYSAYDYVVLPQDKVIVKTDIQIALPSGFYGRVAPRSGLAAKHFIDVGAGVIDEDYRGNVGVVLFNFGKESFEVKKGDRIAQLICERICYPELEELKSLNETERGAGGFGSSGKN